MNLDKLGKVTKKLGAVTVEEIDSLGPEALNALVVQAEQSINQARDELDANPNYVRAKEDKAHLSQGFNDVKARQSAKIQYALHRLSELGG